MREDQTYIMVGRGKNTHPWAGAIYHGPFSKILLFHVLTEIFFRKFRNNGIVFRKVLGNILKK